ncbi:MAG: exo-alpha-sialidase [Bacteroidales bacterium]|nr:exo-alpha-sialidase [Bacteroidales bacterium]
MGKLKIFLPECVNASKYPAYYSSKTLFNRNLIGKLLFSALLFFFILNGLHGKCNCPDKNIIRTPDFSCHDETEAFPEIFPEAIYNPVKICNAPVNESTIIATSAGQYKIFFIYNPGDADKMMSVSSLNGIEWSTPEKEFELPGIAYYANQVVESNDGTLHSVFHIRDEGKNGYNGRHYNLWYTRKVREASEWEPPKEIYNGYVGSIRNFIELKSGRLLMSFGKAVPERSKKPDGNSKDYGWNEIMILYSDDNGDKWHAANNTLNIEIDPDKTTRYGAVEPVIVQLKNDVLWMLIRTNKGVLYQSFSDNNGETWTVPIPSKFTSSDSPAQFLRLKDGRLLLFFNMNQRWDDPNSYAFGGREVLHAALSYDDGKSWKGFREVLRATADKREIRGDRGTAYPSAVETNDGKVILVSGQGESKFVVMFDPEWLIEVNVPENSMIDPDEWTVYGSGDIIHKEYSEKEQKIRFLAGSAMDSRLNPEVVWNFPALASGEMIMEIEFINECPDVNLSFTDHFSISGDSVASEHSVFQFVLANVYGEAKNIPVRIKWNSDKQIAELFIFDKKVSETGFTRIPEFGLNYLRAGVPASIDNMKWGFGLRTVAVK